jgi:trigger factor
MALVEKENFTVADEDIEKRFEQIAAGNPDMLTRVKEHYSTNRKAKDGLISEIKEDKAIQFLLESAVITEVEAAAAQPAE